MRTICILSFFLLSINITNAQTTIVSYEEQIKLPENSAIPTDDPQLIALIQAKLKAMNKTMNLIHNKGISIYQPIDIKSDENVKSMGTGNIIYKDQNKNECISQENIIDREFIITEKLQRPQWSLQNDEKKISNYKCKKATLPNNIIAWYCPDISINDGPSIYWGLPGLIVELETNGMLFKLKDVKVTSDEVKIIKPTKGKSITREKFDELKQKKMKELGVGEGSAEGGIKVIKM